MVADCLPVLWCLSDGSAVAASHAGWRGLAGEGGRGILEATSQALEAVSSPSMEPLVWLGPCIGPRAFEVGAEVCEAFLSADPAAAGCFSPLPTAGKFLANLPALARLRLRAMGITRVHGNDGSDPWCTVTQSSRFFSHRRDAAILGSTGRMAACVWKH
jgi:YfiH family protein